MGRIVGIDYGTKRVGIAATDPLQIIVSPVATIDRSEVLEFLKNYIAKENVDMIVCGHPGEKNQELMRSLTDFIEQLQSMFQRLPIVFQNEHLSSQKASRLILNAGVRKMKRRDKSLIDKVSAVLILQEYLGHLKDTHIA